MYLHFKGLSDLVSRIYSNIAIYEKVKGSKGNKTKRIQFPSRRKLYNDLIPYQFTIRMLFGLCTYDEIRMYFAM